ncbi:hypothetical protein ASF56_24785 [Methylobacterium sp. Leaf122]|nr:hypothetical protein [Methylobacterium sp. Leaf122]KQQ11539.1 hypothetical protein ASF56_24785 [Methylobacterium sp. Leaf122]
MEAWAPAGLRVGEGRRRRGTGRVGCEDLAAVEWVEIFQGVGGELKGIVVGLGCKQEPDKRVSAGAGDEAGDGTHRAAPSAALRVIYARPPWAERRSVGHLKFFFSLGHRGPGIFVVKVEKRR